ncbi:MAG: polysaccharide pyruvyl transferase family protein [Bifidobacteriaceae bacterium]|jgi:hypothetical protein|nr:polysaccharide pyruvyl transferase family protein [Bifidobacteriaceae bacterium]
MTISLIVIDNLDSTDNYRRTRFLKNIFNQTHKNIKTKFIKPDSDFIIKLNQLLNNIQSDYIAFLKITDTFSSTYFEQLFKVISQNGDNVVIPRWAVANEYNIDGQYFAQMPFPKVQSNNFLTYRELLLSDNMPNIINTNILFLPALFSKNSLQSGFDTDYDSLAFWKKLVDLAKIKPIKLVGNSALITFRNLLPNSVLPIPKSLTWYEKLSSAKQALKAFLISIWHLLKFDNLSNNKISSGKIELYQAAKDRNYQVNNFGDILTGALVEKFFGQKLEYAPPLYANMAGAGSMLERLICQKQNNKPIVWGSGFILDDISKVDYNQAHFVLVRGRETLQRISNIPPDITIALGDPGLIVDKIVPRLKNSKYRIGIVPHASEINLPVVKLLAQIHDVKIINPVGTVEKVLQQIASCQYILSSSLHGLIAADAYSMPNIHLFLSDKLHGGIYKFVDYYSVFPTKRHFTVSFEDIINKSADELVKLVTKNYVKPSNLQKLKSNIIKSFPKT